MFEAADLHRTYGKREEACRLARSSKWSSVQSALSESAPVSRLKTWGAEERIATRTRRSLAGRR
jgi:hypothetical protein